MRISTWILAAGLVSALCGARAEAATIFDTTLLGINEVPPNNSNATGSTHVEIVGNLMTVEVEWVDLEGGLPAAAHIHCCTAAGTNIGVAVGFPNFPAVLSGTYVHVFDLLDPDIYTANFRIDFGGGTAGGHEWSPASFSSGRRSESILRGWPVCHRPCTRQLWPRLADLYKYGFLDSAHRRLRHQHRRLMISGDSLN